MGKSEHAFVMRVQKMRGRMKVCVITFLFQLNNRLLADVALMAPAQRPSRVVQHW